ncbi:MAG: hypothetical protein KAH38_09660 [Candidatus Hydrogenedentes bacterium]|nr:hypothetical protein [Candidatus Hydrogenedentota bacterium]
MDSAKEDVFDRMNMRILWILAATGLLASGIAGAEIAGAMPYEYEGTPVAGDREVPTTENTHEHWQFNVSTFAWFPISLLMRTDTAFGVFSQRFKLKQLISMYHGGGMLYITARKGDFGLFADIIYGDLKDSATTNYDLIAINVNFPVENKLQCSILQAGGSYNFGTDRFSLDVFAGARYLYIKGKFSVKGGYVSTKKNFIEPVFGGNLRWRFQDAWTLSAKTSASGFGLGSEITIDGEARISYKISKKVNCYFGYRILDSRYQQKAKDLLKLKVLNIPVPPFIYQDINLNVRSMVHGPIAGVELRW